jgi:exodeoxyribonuclease VII small subunit
MAKTTKPTPAPDPACAQPISYEDALAELERLMATMESGQLPLDSLLAGYTRGAELLGFCRARLEAVEHQVQLLENGTLKAWAAS